MTGGMFVLVLLACGVVGGRGEDVADPWEDVEEQEVISEDEKPFDPVEEMKKLWEQEMQEGKAFKDGLRDIGVNVEKWEDEFGHDQWDEGHVPDEILGEVDGQHLHHHGEL
eukprot:TRINITY_DN22063_c0_g1_i1.p2 TRINITY_DN22063_c0_g1~~TRINITY_DN22063_c0_g1_i1.p2  ORF type:complete len:111 (-),score=46.59 TRINITY_DN22063_c0_g1_i1:80-412(-)